MSERTYKHVSHLDHVTMRPDSYVGSISNRTKERWLCTTMGKPFKLANCKARPAALKILDEILMNASDNSRIKTNPTQTIWVSITPEKIRVENDGQCIPITLQDGMYIPSMVFFKLLTSEHYDDTKDRTSAGLNGYGCKLTSIFSSWARAECHDPGRGLFFEQEYRSNMRETTGPNIRKKKKNRFTTAYSFTPDINFFPKWNNPVNMAIFRRRVCEMAACFPHLKIYFNGARLKINFKKFIQFYTPNKSTTFHYPNWTLGLTLSSTENFQQISFVNGICTNKGGTHVDAITSQMTTHIQTILRKKHKKSTTKLTKKNILQRLFVFVNCTLKNPHFGSQTKEEMTTEVENPPKLTLKEVEKAIKMGGILAELELWLENKELQSLQKKMKGTQKKNISGIPKLNDAQKAGTSESYKCSLILTEGDSAASMAVAGLSVVGRKYYGVMPLKGKMLNVRGKGAKVLKANSEIQNLIKIVGFQYGKSYENVKDLRYGKIIVMADQDKDGFHICGLFLNFIEVFWPSLARLDFLQRFITPLLKVGKKEFFSERAFENWQRQHPNNHQKVKYYKGLGTSTNAEAKDYFRRLNHYVKPIEFDASASENLHLVFDQKLAQKRKIWMNGGGSNIDYSVAKFRISTVIMEELREYSLSTLTRAIPKLIDNLKQAQRKILFAAFKKIRTKEMKVAQFAAFTADVSEYTHGENSLSQAIIKMAQNFPGSNRLPLLKPNGQFGSRLQNGDDAASPRYIYTQLQPYSEFLFHPHDTELLTSVIEEGKQVEPLFYVPILPMILVNGCSGIATAYRTNILPCKLQALFSNLRRLLRNQKMVPMKPFVEGYKGTISEDYLTSGVYNQNKLQVDVTELPLGVSILQYKRFLHQCNYVARFEEKHPNEREIHFKIHLTEERTNLYKDLKLERQLGKSLHALDENGKILSFQNYEEILHLFFRIRMKFYEKRKQYLFQYYQQMVQELNLETLFIQKVLDNPQEPDLTEIPPHFVQKFKNMTISRLESQNIDKCQAKILEFTQLVQYYQSVTPRDLYEKDLNELEIKLQLNSKRKRGGPSI